MSPGTGVCRGRAVLPGTWRFVKATQEGVGVLPPAVPRSWVTGAQEDRMVSSRFHFP